MLVVLDRAVTIDQPPLAVGVRFPLCPPIFLNDDGLTGPVACFLRRDKNRRLTRAEGN